MLEKITKKKQIRLAKLVSELTTHKVISVFTCLLVLDIERRRQQDPCPPKEKKNKLLRTRSECQMR
jgi:hypothetical protein